MVGDGVSVAVAAAVAGRLVEAGAAAVGDAAGACVGARATGVAVAAGPQAESIMNNRSSSVTKIFFFIFSLVFIRMKFFDQFYIIVSRGTLSGSPPPSF